MLKKTLLTFAFLIVITTFYGFNARYGVPVVSLDSGATAYSNPLLREGDYVISAYDAIIRNISEREGNDWRLMSAVAYHESRFRADLVSRRGARGLMQIMPSVARQFRIPVERPWNPKSMSGWLISCGRVSNSRCGCRSNSPTGSYRDDFGFVQWRSRPCEGCTAFGALLWREPRFVGGSRTIFGFDLPT